MARKSPWVTVSERFTARDGRPAPKSIPIPGKAKKVKRLLASAQKRRKLQKAREDAIRRFYEDKMSKLEQLRAAITDEP